MTHLTPRPSRMWGTAVMSVTTACLAFATGCGSDDTKPKADGGSTAASTTAPKSTGTIPVGKRTIGIIGNTFTSETVKQTAEVQAATAKALGWDAIVVDGQGTPDGWNQGYQRLLSKKVDSILTSVIDAGPIQPSLDAAKKAGIPVISAPFDTFADSKKQMTVIGYDTPTQGKQAADMIAKRFPGESVIGDTVSPLWATSGFVNAATKELKTKGVKVEG